MFLLGRLAAPNLFMLGTLFTWKNKGKPLTLRTPWTPPQRLPGKIYAAFFSVFFVRLGLLKCQRPPFPEIGLFASSNALFPCLVFASLAAKKSHRKIAVTTVAASGLATIPLQKSRGFPLRRPQKKSLAASDFVVTLIIAGSWQRPRPQDAAAARFRGRSNHGTQSPGNRKKNSRFALYKEKPRHY